MVVPWGCLVHLDRLLVQRVEIICGVFCVSRQSELSVKLNRQLERCLRNSKCIDTESLCVVSGEKVIHTHTRQTRQTERSFIF